MTDNTEKEVTEQAQSTTEKEAQSSDSNETSEAVEVNESKPSKENASFDFILFGATSFVGKIFCEYMTATYSNSDVNWAIAGRSQSKLDTLKSELGATAKDLPVLVADSSDESSLQALCDKTKVVVSTVGPYALYGEPLVKICAETGTDYCDLTGEAQWIAAMVRKYQKTAEKSGARIVNSCGFDSIPSDLGVFFLQEQSQAQFKQDCFRIKMRVKAANGGFSGGTVASLMNVVKEASENPALRRELANPYALCPDGHPFFAHQASNSGAKYDSDFKRWIAPFVMAAINTRIVHRSNSLLNNRYGNNFLYDEAMLMKSKWVAKSMSLVLGLFMVGSAFKPTRSMMEKLFLPKPGEGPSKEEQEKGFFNLQFFGETAAGNKIRAKVTGDKDPGYGSTAKMLAETAIHFANLSDQQPGGFWTPASLFGTPLIDRLQEKAGLSFELMD